MIAGFSITSLLLILLAGVGAGFVGYAVGASSLVSYPALLAFGIPPVLANASNTVGVVGPGIGGVMGGRRELKGQSLRAITYVHNALYKREQDSGNRCKSKGCACLCNGSKIRHIFVDYR